MANDRKTGAARGQGTVQLCWFAVILNRKAARAITENNKITASAAVLAFSRLTRDDQLRLCAEARQEHMAAQAAR
jgi:hypothetical protein